MVMHAFLSTLEVRQVDLFEFQNSQSHIVRQCLKLKKNKTRNTKPKQNQRRLSGPYHLIRDHIFKPQHTQDSVTLKHKNPHRGDIWSILQVRQRGHRSESWCPTVAEGLHLPHGSWSLQNIQKLPFSSIGSYNQPHECKFLILIFKSGFFCIWK